ncbi:hypothetical protein AK812_SmicGene42897 [Symbiodinium microadriaticum]|uniref:Uncharacterized protein n=1 Tax=Symbiodinium microadriaticum TaxID=2951 RepID=A0A1Q9C2D1_SYMMI|nr:hypothetical protein AK812_SmicGene42897 [Symbiodinium microadriaticum]
MVASPRAEVKQDQWAAALEELLEEVRLSILKDSATDLLDGDPRLQTIFERVSEKLTEAPGEGGKELSDAKSAQRLWTRLCDGLSLSPCRLFGVVAQTL